MTDDIVTRLREYSKSHSSILYDDTQEAADEIERLQAEVDKWKKVATKRNPYSWANLVNKRWGAQ